VEDLDRLPAPALDAAEVRALFADNDRARNDAVQAESDNVLRSLQALMFAYDISVWKHGARLEMALTRLAAIRAEFAGLAAPHTHELVRLKETEAMLLAAELILRASLYRTESRMSHFREDFDLRDDRNWLCWVDICDHQGEPRFEKTPVPVPICDPDSVAPRSVKRVIKGAA